MHYGQKSSNEILASQTGQYIKWLTHCEKGGVTPGCNFGLSFENQSV